MENLILVGKLFMIGSGFYLILLSSFSAVEDTFTLVAFKILPMSLGVGTLFAWFVWSGFIIQIP